jgi:hypothetical protein
MPLAIRGGGLAFAFCTPSEYLFLYFHEANFTQ